MMKFLQLKVDATKVRLGTRGVGPERAASGGRFGWRNKKGQGGVGFQGQMLLPDGCHELVTFCVF